VTEEQGDRPRMVQTRLMIVLARAWTCALVKEAKLSCTSEYLVLGQAEMALRMVVMPAATDVLEVLARTRGLVDRKAVISAAVRLHTEMLPDVEHDLRALTRAVLTLLQVMAAWLLALLLR